MIIHKLSLIEGAKSAEGLVVVIDVFRAFTTECYLFNGGIEKIYPVATIDEVFQLSKTLEDTITFGERGGIKLEGFDYGNSPSLIYGLDFRGRVGIHTTSAGTQGIVSAKNADEIITGSFVNARAIAEYIKKKDPEVVTLVSMGSHGLEKTDEDELCADYIEALLLERSPMTEKEIKDKLYEAGAIFRIPDNQSSMPEEDFDCCLKVNHFDFVIRVEETNLGLCAMVVK